MKSPAKKILFSLFLSVLLVFDFFASDAKKFNFLGNGEIFKLDPLTDGLLSGSGVALSGSYLIIDKLLKLNQNTFDGQLLNKNDVNAFDRPFMQPYSKPIHIIATGIVGLELISPLVFIACDKEEWFTIGTMYIEAFLLSYGIKELAKILVDRPRPYMYFDNYPQDKVDEGDWCKSFPSGHTTNAFMGASFTSYVFWKYFPDSPWRFLVTSATYALAVTTGCLRIASGNHFLTDVLAGAAIGTCCGLLVPFLHTFNTKQAQSTAKLSLHISPFDVGLSVKL